MSITEQHPTIITMDADKMLNWMVGFKVPWFE